jgi:hypothetical protein
MRRDLEHEKSEKLIILKDLNTLKEKYLSEIKTSPEAQF